MSSKAPTAARKARNGKRGLRDVVKGQGRTFRWLARVTGYSEEQISRVANGHHPGSERFHIAMRHALGEEYVA